MPPAPTECTAQHFSVCTPLEAKSICPGMRRKRGPARGQACRYHLLAPRDTAVCPAVLGRQGGGAPQGEGDEAGDPRLMAGLLFSGHPNGWSLQTIWKTEVGWLCLRG